MEAKKNKTNKLTLRYILNLGMISYPVFYPLLSIFGHFGKYFIFAFWFILTIYKTPEFLKDIFNKTLIFFAFLFVYSLRVALNIDFIDSSFFSPIRVVSQLTTLYVYYIFCLYNIKYSSMEEKEDLLKTFLISINISIIISLYYLSKNKYAIRRSFDYNYFAIGDFNLVYTCIFVNVIIFNKLINKRSNFWLILSFILSGMLVINSSYMTAILNLAVGWGTVIYLNIFDTKLKKITSIAIILTLIPIFLSYSSKLFLQLSNINFFTDAIRIRFFELSQLLEFGQISSGNNAIFARFSHATNSLRTFGDNLFIGLNIKYYSASTISSHVQWPDNLARFGIFGNIILVYQVYIWFKYSINRSEDNIQKNTFMALAILFIFQGFINNVMMPGVFISLFFIPLLI